MTADSHPDEEQSSIDAVVVSDRGTFWAAIHRMSSAGYRPSRISGAFGELKTPAHVYGALSRTAGAKRGGWR